MFYRLFLVTVLVLMLIGCGDEGVIPDSQLTLAPAAPSLIQQNCPAYLYKNTTNMRYIPSGSFTMGGAYETDHHRTPEWIAETDAFYMDMHEVTIGDFLLFMDQTGYQLEWNVNIPSEEDMSRHDIIGLHPNGIITRCLCRFRGMMLWRMQLGLVNGCQPKWSGRKLHVAVLKVQRGLGEMRLLQKQKC